MLHLGQNGDADDTSVCIRVSQSRYSTSNSKTTCGTTELSPGQWYHIAGTYASNHQEIYVNGVKETDDTDPAIADTMAAVADKPMYIGRLRLEPDGGYFNGSIDGLMIFDQRLSQEQIQALYLGEENKIVEQEIEKADPGNEWNVCSTPNDGGQDGLEICSNPNMTIGDCDVIPVDDTVIAKDSVICSGEYIVYDENTDGVIQMVDGVTPEDTDVICDGTVMIGQKGSFDGSTGTWTYEYGFRSNLADSTALSSLTMCTIANYTIGAVLYGPYGGEGMNISKNTFANTTLGVHVLGFPQTVVNENWFSNSSAVAVKSPRVNITNNLINVSKGYIDWPMALWVGDSYTQNKNYVEHNRIFGGGSIGALLYMRACGECVVHNNTFENKADVGINLHGPWELTDSNITNNTFGQAYRDLVLEFNSDGNYIYYNNFSYINTNRYAYDTVGGNQYYYTTAAGADHGNCWREVRGIGSPELIDISPVDKYADGGTHYPYSDTYWYQIEGYVEDYGPLMFP